MTTTPTHPAAPEREPVVPEGKMMGNLTAGELSWVSRKIGANVLVVAGDPTHLAHIECMAYIACAWARRKDMSATVDQFLALEYPELLQALRAPTKPAPDAVAAAEVYKTAASRLALEEVDGDPSVPMSG